MYLASCTNSYIDCELLMVRTYPFSVTVLFVALGLRVLPRIYLWLMLVYIVVAFENIFVVWHKVPIFICLR